MKNQVRSLCWMTAICSAATATVPAFAQSGSTSTMLEEIVITAEKREANAQKTSIAMTVVKGEDLVTAGVTDMKGLANVAPDLSITTNTLFTQIGVRGVSSQDIGELGDSAITIGIDGEYINRPVALNAAFFDVSRIEVLRGPQGTLYGRNATAGAVNIITNKPKHEFDASVSVDGGNYSAVGLQGMVNVPLGDMIAVRAAVMTAKHDGYTDNGPAGKGDDQDSKAARLSLLLEPNESLSAMLTGEYIDVDQTAVSQYGVPVTVASADTTGAYVGSPAHFTTPQPDAYPLGSLGVFKSHQYAVRGQFNYKFNWATLAYVGGYRDVSVHAMQPLNGFVPAIFNFDNDQLNSKTQSHELRLSGGDETAFFWQAGVFYSDEKQQVARGLYLPLVGNNYVNFFLFPNIESKSTAEFVQISGHFTDNLKWTVGARHTSDKKDRQGVSFPPFSSQYPNHPTSTAGGTPDNGTGDWTKNTWLAGLDWQITNDNLLYGKVSTGYKAGGFDNVGAYEPESLTAYELGSKNRFLDQRLQLNVAAFYYDYKDLQTSVFISSAVGSAVQNAGKATYKGLESELQAALTQHDRVTLTVNYLDAEFDQLLTVRNRAGQPGVPVNLAGNHPVQAPKWTLAASYQHVFPLGDYGQLAADLSSRYKSSYYVQPFNWAADKQKSYTMSDFSLTYTAPSTKWDVAAYVRNIENERLLGFAAFTGDTINIYNFIYGPPRTYGARFDWHW